MIADRLDNRLSKEIEKFVANKIEYIQVKFTSLKSYLNRTRLLRLDEKVRCKIQL